MKKLHFTVWMLTLTFAVLGQIESNLRQKIIPSKPDTILLDSLSISYGTVIIDGMDSTDYIIDYPAGKLIWITKPKQDSLFITYRTWPINISKPVSHKSTSVFMPDASGKVNPFSFQGNVPGRTNFSTGKLDKSGSISRGMLFGNNQNLGINSNMNLQLSGDLTPNIKIKAVISDNNIPVQPDGNTQLIQDFDQVFIQLFNDKWKLVTGDFRINKPQSHFMVFDKRVRGGGFTTQFDVGTKVKNYLSFNAALSRGKFSRNVIQGIEGNQGPYRLKGNDNESFIIILSGTEEVYIDGKKLVRGQENDYVIDYNKAEIFFTAKQPINRDKRIVVEFQYSAQAYGRSLIQVSNYLKTSKLKLNFNLYAEQDNKNAPLLQDLNEENKLLLENIGDDISRALVPSVKQVEFSSNRVLYKLVVDTVTNDSIYVYSTHPDSAMFLLTFSHVGQGNGDYIEISSTANGRVFEYVPRIDGAPQGVYSPVILLITPKKKQMLSFGGEYSIGLHTKIHFEGAITNFDENTFSDIGNQNNVGTGFFIGVEKVKVISRDTASLWHLKSIITYENRTDNFEEVQRYRSVEFDRNWNVRNQTLTGMQHLPTAEFQFFKQGLGGFGYQFRSFISGSSYQGVRHQLYSNLDNSQFTVRLTGSILSSEGGLGQTKYYRHKALIQRKYKHLNIGFRDDFEHNLKRGPSSDTLMATSYSWFEWETFIVNADSAKNRFKIGYIHRVNDNIRDNRLSRATIAQSINGQLSLISNPRTQVQVSSRYRVLDVKDTNLYQGKPEQNLTNRIDYSLRLFKGAMSLSSFYEIGSGLVEEQSFVYVEVPAGNGVYTWIDYNANGIAEQNEFEIARFQDQANFVRVLTQTNKFEKVYRTQFNQSVFVRPPSTWNSKQGVCKILSKFSNQFAYRIDRKAKNKNIETWVNPFADNIADSSIRAMNSSLRNTVYLNRSSKLWSIDYTFQKTSSKLLQTYGILGTNNQFNQINFRYNMSKVYQINLKGKLGSKGSGATLFSNRNYHIVYSSFSPVITYMQGSGVKIKLFFEQTNKRNQADLGGETNLSKKFGAELNVRKVGKGSIIVSGSYLLNNYEGNEKSPIAFQILEGLQPGKNGLWEVTYQRTIAKYLQLNIRYNGRVSEDNPVIHTGSVQVRAFF